METMLRGTRQSMMTSSSGRCAQFASPARRLLVHRCKRQRAAVKAEAAAQILKVSSEELQKELSERTVPIVIDFYATWCGPCLLLAKELEKVAEEVGDAIKILKVDTDENLELSNQLRIEGLPTMVFVGTSANKPAIRIEGLYPAQTIVKIIKEDLFESEEAESAPMASS